MVDERMTPGEARFRRVNGPDMQRCGGYLPLLACGMFLPKGSMLTGSCDSVDVEATAEGHTDDEHTCAIWAPRTEADNYRDDTEGYYDGDADDAPRSLSARMRKAAGKDA